MSWNEEVYNRDRRALLQLLQRYLDPFEYLDAAHYLELARTLLDYYRCEKAEKAWKGGAAYVEDVYLLLSELVRMCADSAIEKYKVSEYREKLEKYLREVRVDELQRLQKYLKLGLQLAGLNLPSLAPYMFDPMFLKYVGSVIKVAAIIAAQVSRFWAQRAIRKFSVRVEELARALIREIEQRLKTVDEAVIDLTRRSTEQRQLEELSRKLLSEEVYANTLEVVALARRLQRLRMEFLLEIKR